jgi:hypothetical protein
MANGEWQIANSKWRIANGKWRMNDKVIQVAIETLEDHGQRTTDHRRAGVVCGLWSVVKGARDPADRTGNPMEIV